MKIEKIPVALLKPYFRNPRDASNSSKPLQASIEKFGFTVPIITDMNNLIIAGHNRYHALISLGIETADVVRVDISEEEARRYRIDDNAIHDKTEWVISSNDQILGIEDLLDGVVDITGVMKVFSDFIDYEQEESISDTETEESIPEEEEILCPHCYATVTKDDIVEDE